MAELGNFQLVLTVASSSQKEVGFYQCESITVRVTRADVAVKDVIFLKEKHMVELVVYPKPDNKLLINNSPFCSKSEIYLRMIDVEHSIAEVINPGKYPNGKLPVLIHDRKIIADSDNIEKYCNKVFNIDLNSHLSDEEKTIGYSFRKMIEEFLYWGVLYERWLIDENWIRVREMYFGGLPKLVRLPVGWMVRRKTRISAIGHGMARHSTEEILRMSKEGIDSISIFLAGKDYFFGNQVTSFDATVYGFVANLLYSDKGPETTKMAQNHKNLERYCRRMHGKYF